MNQPEQDKSLTSWKQVWKHDQLLNFDLKVVELL